MVATTGERHCYVSINETNNSDVLTLLQELKVTLYFEDSSDSNGVKLHLLQDIRKQLKYNNQLCLPHQDDCKPSQNIKVLHQNKDQNAEEPQREQQ